MSSGNNFSKSFPSFLYDFIQICSIKFSGGLDEENFVLLEWSRKDEEVRNPREGGLSESLSPVGGFSVIGP